MVYLSSSDSTWGSVGAIKERHVGRDEGVCVLVLIISMIPTCRAGYILVWLGVLVDCIPFGILFEKSVYALF